MAYTKKEARAIAEQIHTRFGARIAAAVKGTPVPPEFVAGLIGVEAGKDNAGQFKENATRFEPHVFAKLQSVRDGEIRQYSRITPKDLKGASDEALKALARSYGLTQIMGWWTIHLGGKVADLRDPQKHLDYTIKLLMLNSKGDFEREEYEGEFREWNTGRERGKTYHADYVANATAVMNAYADLGPVDPLVTESVTEQKERAEAELQKKEPVEAEQPTQPGPAEPAQDIRAIPPLPVKVPDWAKKILKWGASLNLGGLGVSFATLQNNPEALMAVLNILKWGFIALGVVAGVVAIGAIVTGMWNAKLANDLNVARLQNYADPETDNIDFSGWKAAPDKTEVKL